MNLVVELPTGDWAIVDDNHPLQLHAVSDEDLADLSVGMCSLEEVGFQSRPLVPTLEAVGVKLPR